MFYRQKILLALIEAFGRRLNNTDLQKYLFLFGQKYQKEASYDFVPYRFGCFSFQSYADKRNLITSGFLSEKEDKWELAGKQSFLSEVNEKSRREIEAFKKDYANKKGNKLVREVYTHYPYYAINSEVANELLSADELAKVEAARPDNDDYCFFTIGYEGASFENYLNRLIQNNVRLLCDVRRNPLSRKYGFSKKTLSKTLKELNITYVHMPELGIVSKKRQGLNNQADYNRLFSEYERTTLKDNKQALKDLLVLLKKHKRIAITCFEAEPCMCHRGRVAKAISKLLDWDCSIEHL